MRGYKQIGACTPDQSLVLSGLLSRRRLPFASRENEEVVGSSRSVRSLFSLARFAPAFLPAHPSLAPRAGWLSPQLCLGLHHDFASFPVGFETQDLRCLNTGILFGKSANPQASWFIARVPGPRSVSVPPPTRRCQIRSGRRDPFAATHI
jgi:hypothetical protein